MNFWIFIFLLLISIFSFFSKDVVRVGLVRNMNTVILFPIEKTISFVSNLFTLHRENTGLRKEITQISMEMQRCANIRKENESLRQLYGFKPLKEFSLVSCEIIGKSPGLYNESIILDRGEKDGIRKHLPVIAAYGLAGKIIETSAVSSEMLTLHNRNTLVSALDLRSRVQGIIKWSHSSLLYFDDVPLHSDVMVGDTIITSGMGGVYPQGMFIGIVQSTSESPKEIVMSIKVKPFVDISVLEDVFVIKEMKTADSISSPQTTDETPAYFDIIEPIKDPGSFGASSFGKDEGKEEKKLGIGVRGITIE